jgi:hypothetical protein
MKVIIEEIGRDRDEEIIIRCWEANDEILSYTIPSCRRY